MSDDDKPVRIVSKREKNTAKVGLISQGLPNIPAGTKYYRAYQKAAGSNKHSGPSGRKAKRGEMERLLQQQRVRTISRGLPGKKMTGA
jgi:hypothetical protein